MRIFIQYFSYSSKVKNNKQIKETKNKLFSIQICSKTSIIKLATRAKSPREKMKFISIRKIILCSSETFLVMKQLEQHFDS